jgi:ribosome hibernation promoting factor
MKPKTVSQDLDAKLIIQAVHFPLTEAMQNIFREKFARLLVRNEYIVRVNVRIHQDQTMGTEHHYTLTGQIEIGGPDLVASVNGNNAYDLSDLLLEKLEHLLERRQGKRKDKRNHPHGTELDASLPKTEEV